MRRTATFTLFISRRCSYKLRARIKQGARLWTNHPLELIHAWYHSRQPSNGQGTLHPQLVPKRFTLPSTMQRSLAEFGLHPDKRQSSSSSSQAAASKLTYTVSKDTASLWTSMLLRVLGTMLDSYRTSAVWTSETQAALWEVLVGFSHTLTSGIIAHLITLDLAEHLDEKRRQGRQSVPPLEGSWWRASSQSQTIAETSLICQRLSCVHRIPRRSACLLVGRHMGKETGTSMVLKAIAVLTKPPMRTVKTATTAPTTKTTTIAISTISMVRCTVLSAYVISRLSCIADATAGVPEAAKQSVLRYLQTLCIAFYAADFFNSYAKRMGKRDMQLQAYVLSSKPSIPAITAATVREFADKFTDHFFPTFGPETNVAVAFEELARKLESTPFDAVEHAEAIVMALACDSAGMGADSALGSQESSKATTAIQAIFYVRILFYC